MTFVKGQSGNPHGRTGEKTFTNELRAALNVTDPKTKRRKLAQVVGKLVDKAIEGEGWAIQMISDRLDGKPAQETTLTVQHKPVREMSDDEISSRLLELRVIRGGDGVTASDADEAGGSSESDGLGETVRIRTGTSS